MKTFQVCCWAFFALLLFSSVCSADVYDIDPDHSRITFKVKHLVISTVEGRFLKFNGTFEGDPDNISVAKTSATIDASTISTDQPKRDEHLRGDQFLDVAKFPAITFKSTKVVPIDQQRFRLAGDLTIHGVTLPITLDVENGGMVKDPWGKERAVFSATTTLNRKDFGLTYSPTLETGGLVVGEEVKVEIQIQGIKRK